MVFEASQWAGVDVVKQTVRGIDERADFADRARLERIGGAVDKAETCDVAPARAEGIAENLEACANRENLLAGIGCLFDAAVGNQMLHRDGLRDVLAAADGVNIQVGGYGIAQLDWDDLGVNPTHPRALPQHQRISIIAVGAQHVREDQADRQLAHLLFLLCSFDVALQIAEGGVVRQHLNSGDA